MALFLESLKRTEIIGEYLYSLFQWYSKEQAEELYPHPPEGVSHELRGECAVIANETAFAYRHPGE